MRKNSFLFIFIILLMVVSVGVLFSCSKVEEPTGDVEGDVIGVSTGMGTVYSSLLAADGSKDQTVYYLTAEGGYTDGEKSYDVSLAAEIDVTQANIENDVRTKLSLEVKSGTTEVLALYYSDGTLYINCMPYVSRGRISDFSMAEKLAELHREKNRSSDTMNELVPKMASKIFSGCKYYYKAETKESRYVFTLSYAKLFSALSELLDDNADLIGITSVELLAALHVTDALQSSLASDEAGATVEFVLSDGAFVSAKAEGAGKAIELRSFRLTRDAVTVGISSAVSDFTEFDARNVYVQSGKARLSFDREEGDVDMKKYGIAANLLFVELTYPFDYTLTTHYVAGSGLEGSLFITDKNEKTTSFVLKGGDLYIDLSAYGLAKCKIARSELLRRIGELGMADTDAYTFKDKVRLASLLAAGITKEGDRVTCSFGKEVFALLFEKIGFREPFDVTGGTLSWSVADNTISDVSLSVSLLGMTLSLTSEYEAFSFGTPREVTLPEDADAYADLAENASTHVSLAGTVSQQTSFSNAGALLSSLLSSLSGEAVTFSAEGNELTYTAELLYGASGVLDRALVAFKSKGSELVQLYYTSEDTTHFYLILPPDSRTTLRPIRKLAIAEAPFDAFNRAMELERSEQAGKIYLSASDDAFMFGASATFASDALAALGRIHEGLTCRWMDEMAFRRVEFRIFADKMEGRVIFDSRSSLIVTANTVSVKYNDPFDIETIEPENAATDVSLFADNAMPTYALITFTNTVTVPTLKVSMNGLWTYPESQVPQSARNDSQTVTASASLLAKRVERTLTVDCTPPVTATLTPVSEEVGVYDSNTKTFTFPRYGAKKVKEVLAKFDQATLAGYDGIKAVTDWTTPSAITAEYVNIQPKVRSYFGNEVSVGVVFKLHFTGDKVTSSQDEVAFKAYDGRDPFVTASYPDTITALTESGTPVTVTVGKWDPSAALKVKEAYEQNRLFAFAETDVVKAQIYDCLGNRDTIDVTVRFTAKQLPADDDIDFDMTGLVGTTYDKEHKTFYFDVLSVRSLSATSWDGVLPTSLLVDGKVYFSNFNWAYEKVDEVSNSLGQRGEIRLSVGDNVSGFQSRTFNYVFTPITVTATALLDEAGETIAEQTEEELYTYAFDNVNVFTYSYPTYIKVTYTKGEEEGLTARLAANWSFDHDFTESSIVNGGTYVGTSYVGSEAVSVTFTFEHVHAYGYDFVTEDGKISIPAYVAADGTHVSGGDLVYAENNRAMRLIFSVKDTMANKLRYFDPESYPSQIRIYLDPEKKTSVDVAVDRWDLSSYEKKPNIVTKSFVSDDKTPMYAIVRGQKIKVATYVSSIIEMSDEVYTNETIAEQYSVKFNLITADKTSVKNYKVNDPRKAESYPTSLVVKNAGVVTRSIPIIKWEGYDAFDKIFADALKKGTPVQEISGRALCKAYIGDDRVGVDYVEIEVVLDATVLEDLDVTGFLAAVSSELAATETGSAVKRIAGSGTRVGTNKTFEYAFSLEMNPFYVSPSSVKSYPRYLTFELNGIPVKTEAKWDISEVDPDATKLGNTYKYKETDDPCGFPVYAELELGGDLPNIKIGVEVNVKSREIAHIWIDGSSQPYIYINGYADAPFGKNMVGNESYIKVDVQFVGDLLTYPLYLHYDTSGISLAYDGTGLKDESTNKDFMVWVGNDSGGYQPISGYGIRVIKKKATNIGVVNGESVTTFYERLEALDGSFVENFYHVDDLVTIVNGEPRMPTELQITFSDGSAPVRVHEYRTARKDEGLVFEWIRDESDRLGIRLWNSNVNESIRGVDQVIYNREHTKDQASVTAGLIFSVESYVLPYGDTADTYLTPAKVLEAFATNFKVVSVEEKYQTRFIIPMPELDGEGHPIIDEKNAIAMGDTIHAGEYLICVKVEGHGLYKGTASIPFTVTPKNVEEEVVLLVDGNVNKSALKNGLNYSGRAYLITATSGTYAVNVKMTVNGAASVALQDVKYTDAAPYEVLAYSLVVRSDNRDYSVGENNVGKEYLITVNELGLDDSDIVVNAVTWNAGNKDFDFTVYSRIDNGGLKRYYVSEENLTHGYVVKYYSDVNHEDLYTGELAAGKTYYYIITVKLENYLRDYRSGSVTVPAS